MKDATYYRSFSTLVRRDYANGDVMHYVLSLSNALRIAVMQGWDDAAEDILALLRASEPFDAVDDLRETYLRIGYYAHVMRDNAEALWAAENAATRHGNDERLQGILEILRNAESSKVARRSSPRHPELARIATQLRETTEYATRPGFSEELRKELLALYEARSDHE